MCESTVQVTGVNLDNMVTELLGVLLLQPGLFEIVIANTISNKPGRDQEPRDSELAKTTAPSACSHKDAKHMQLAPPLLLLQAKTTAPSASDRQPSCIKIKPFISKPVY